jgi:hypothetical protein
VREMMDYVISLVFGGVAFVLVLGFQLGLREAATGQVFSGAVQQDLVSATRTLEYDFQKIGFGCTDSLKIVQADTSAIEFKSDIDADGVVDLVSYSLGSPVPGSSNPAARMLFRKINGDPSMPIAGGVSRFRITYFDDSGNLAGAYSRIRSIYVALTVESNEGTGDVFPAVCWESMIRPRNLR